MKLRFRGHTDTLNALCQAFHERPRQALTAVELTEITGREFRDIHQRLGETPELFLPLPAKPNTNRRYRLAGQIERMSPQDTAAFIDRENRSETRIAVAIGSGLAALVALAATLSLIS